MLCLSFVVFDLSGDGVEVLEGLGWGCVGVGGCVCGVRVEGWRGRCVGCGVCEWRGCVGLGVRKQWRVGRCVRVIRGQTGGGGAVVSLIGIFWGSKKWGGV